MRRLTRVLAFPLTPILFIRDTVNQIRSSYEEAQQLVAMGIETSEDILLMSIVSDINVQLTTSLNMLNNYEIPEEELKVLRAEYEVLKTQANSSNLSSDQMPSLFQKYFISLDNLMEFLNAKYPKVGLDQVFLIANEVQKRYVAYSNSYIELYVTKIGKKQEALPIVSGNIGIA